MVPSRNKNIFMIFVVLYAGRDTLHTAAERGGTERLTPPPNTRNRSVKLLLDQNQNGIKEKRSYLQVMICV